MTNTTNKERHWICSVIDIQDNITACHRCNERLQRLQKNQQTHYVIRYKSLLSRTGYLQQTLDFQYFKTFLERL